MLQAWVKDRTEHLAASSLAVAFVELKAMFQDATEDRIIGVNPCGGVSLPTIERGDRYIPKAVEVHKLGQGLIERYRPIPYIAAGCGLRPSEIFGLELAHVDFLRREIKIEQQLKHTTELGTHIAKVKTVTSARTVELPAIVAEVLARHIEMYPPRAIEMDDLRDAGSALGE
jgi:integrase